MSMKRQPRPPNTEAPLQRQSHPKSRFVRPRALCAAADSPLELPAAVNKTPTKAPPHLLPPRTPLSPLAANSPVRGETGFCPPSPPLLPRSAPASTPARRRLPSPPRTPLSPLEASISCGVAALRLCAPGNTSSVAPPVQGSGAPVGTASEEAGRAAAGPMAARAAAAAAAAAGAAASRAAQRCKVAFLGPAGCELGVGTRSGTGRAFGAVVCCARLRCTACDFTVARVEGARWAPETSYLFLRLNMTNPQDSCTIPPCDAVKLGPMLIAAPSACAYACQCSWRTVVAAEPVCFHGSKSESGKPLRWCCSGHMSGHA